jgi:hypothetical protein
MSTRPTQRGCLASMRSISGEKSELCEQDQEGQMGRQAVECAYALCKSTFVPTNGRNRYCSPDCREKGALMRCTLKPCKFCGTVFAAKRDHIQFCSNRCGAHYQRDPTQAHCEPRVAIGELQALRPGHFFGGARRATATLD